MLQLDPVSAIAPSADLVAWSRLGSAYEPKHLQGAVADRDLIELLAFLRPAEDLALYRAEMARWAGNGEASEWKAFRREWVAANDRCRRDQIDVVVPNTKQRSGWTRFVYIPGDPTTLMTDTPGLGTREIGHQVRKHLCDDLFQRRVLDTHVF